MAFIIVHSSANATPAFEGRGGEDLGTEISNCLMSSYKSKVAFDLSKLCILPGVRCWKLYIDILVSRMLLSRILFSDLFDIISTHFLQILECGGNLFDAVSMAVKAALYNTRLPRVKAAGLDGGAVDLELSDDPFDCIRLDTSQVPVLVTLCKVSIHSVPSSKYISLRKEKKSIPSLLFQIGDHCVVDPTAEEEECSVALAVVAVTPQGVITTTVKLGDGSFSHDRFYEVLKVSMHDQISG